LRARRGTRPRADVRPIVCAAQRARAAGAWTAPNRIDRWANDHAHSLGTRDDETTTFETLGPAGLFAPSASELDFQLDENTGAFTSTATMTSPAVITVHFSGTISGGTISGSGTIDYNSDGTIEETVELSGEKHTTGHVVRGTMTFPFDYNPSSEMFLGTKFWVAVDNDEDGGNGQTAAYQGVASGSNNACFIMLNVPAGVYHVYGVLSTSGDVLAGGAKSGDYSGSTNGAVTVSDSSTFVDFYATPDYSAMAELVGTWNTPDDSSDEGADEQELKFYGDSTRGFDEALLDWARPNFESVEATGTSRVVYIDGDARTAVVYHYDHPDESQQNTYSKFIWTEPTEPEVVTSDFQLYQNAADIPDALAETDLIDASYVGGLEYTKQ
jgi:hypothetical protein